MASTGARAVLFNTSLNRLIEAMPKIAKATGVAPVAIPTHSRDVQLLAAQQLESLANWAESLVAHFEPTKDTEDAKPDSSDKKEVESVPFPLKRREGMTDDKIEELMLKSASDLKSARAQDSIGEKAVSTTTKKGKG
jgi:hypothetical protein